MDGKPFLAPQIVAGKQEDLQRIVDAVSSMFQEARLGNTVDVAGIAPLVEEISSSVSRNPGELISLARIKSFDNYIYMQSSFPPKPAA